MQLGEPPHRVISARRAPEVMTKPETWRFTVIVAVSKRDDEMSQHVRCYEIGAAWLWNLATCDKLTAMRTSVTSGPTFSFCITIALVTLLFVSDKANAKRGCASFGHSCFGGHGKRFDSAMRRNVLQVNNGRNFQESEVLLPNDELFYVLPSDGFRERSDQAFMRVRKDTQQQQVDPDPLSSLVDQWIAAKRSHRKLIVSNE
ncbi:hypothetical protein HN011_012115 [Eciton burchellii]|nr:hypothetical protein HN011_012115 [Eciton burchellii]